MLIQLLACNGQNFPDSGFVPPSDTGPVVTETCEDDADCEDHEICEEEACTDGDRNNTIDEAEEILWDQPADGILQSTDDQDFFTFTAEGGEYIRVHTETFDEDMNTLVSLYSPTGKLHAQEDDHALGGVSTYDTVMYAYLPSAGDWTLLVEELNGDGYSGYSYDVELSEFGGYTEDPDTISDGYELGVEAGYYYAVGWLLEEPGDVDYIQLSLPYDECPTVLTGSSYAIDSDATPIYELISAEGELLLRKESPGGDNGSGFYFEVDGGDAVITVTDNVGGGGETHWGFVYVRVYDRGYFYTYEEEPNDYDGTATVLDVEWETTSDGQLGSAFGWGWIDSPGDEDWWSVAVDPEHYLYINGTADYFGSLIDAEVAVYNSDGELVGEGSDEGVDDLFSDVDTIGPLPGGQYFIQVTNKNSESGPATYYRFSAYQTDY